LVCQRSRIANIRSVIGTFDPRSPLRAILVTSRDETISASIARDAEDAKGGDGSAPFGHLRALCLRDRQAVDRDDRQHDTAGQNSPRGTAMITSLEQ